jgi:hypothetical protein
VPPHPFRSNPAGGTSIVVFRVMVDSGSG